MIKSLIIFKNFDKARAIEKSAKFQNQTNFKKI